ncbi:MAG TPA: 16S rRNA (guanine(966)-N(2))-methyltransferase RsmD [Acidimicrobiia bacterium]|nr:16S rRNA (guanine(966)-N(2))-methyltransferase RsmD [Acidimicrobiia bacterium]
MPRPRLRVIAGTAGGRRLVAPATVRPTTDRVREALFASLGDHVRDARVLDLYAGSGAVAVEALSRGAARAVLVEVHPVAVEACHANLTAAGLADRAVLRAVPVAAFLAATPVGPPFDFVFADPPYEEAGPALTAALAVLAEPGWLAPGARVVVETPARGDRVRDAAGPRWEIRSERRYGDTLLTTLGPVPHI